ncbi:MAG: hypothetical protein CSB46_09370 [Micrococcales bacterium]|nr:MAG: hypothetical protein CSB46_09370 [Micrococcales bacterium]
MWATMLHGALEHDEFRRDWLTHVARQAGSRWQPQVGTSGAQPSEHVTGGEHQTTRGAYNERRERMLDALAAAVEENLDLDALLRLAGHHPGAASPARVATESEEPP